MSEPKEQVISFEGGSGQTQEPSVQPQGNGQEQKAVTPQFVTQEALERSIQDVMGRTQGLVDKNANRLQQEMQSRLAQVENSIKLVETSGVELSAEQKQAMRNSARDQVLIGADAEGEKKPGSTSSDSADTQKAPAQEKAGTSAQELNAASKVGLEIMADYGVEIYPGTKYAEMVNRSGTKAEYFSSLEAACKAKKADTALQGSGVPTSSGMSGQTHVEPLSAKSTNELWALTGLASKK